MVRWFLGIEFESDVGNLWETALKGGIGGDGVFYSFEQGFASDFEDDARVFEGEAVTLSTLWRSK